MYAYKCVCIYYIYTHRSTYLIYTNPMPTYMFVYVYIYIDIPKCTDMCVCMYIGAYTSIRYMYINTQEYKNT